MLAHEGSSQLVLNLKRSIQESYLGYFLSFFLLLMTPSGSSIIQMSRFWSLESNGATEMSLTARNLPQLFKCSFSRRKKFHTNLLKHTHIPFKSKKFIFSLKIIVIYFTLQSLSRCLTNHKVE